MVALVRMVCSTIALSTGQFSLPAQERDQQREAGAEAGRLDRREQADIHAADGHDDDEKDGDRLLERRHALRHGGARAGGPGVLGRRQVTI